MKKFVLSLLSVLSLTLVFSIATPSGYAYAECPDASTSKGQVLKGIDVTGDCDDTGVNRFINAIVKIVSYLAGIVAIIMILISAFRYITSGGDSNKIATAKSTLIYALVGLAIAVLAQVLVNLVLSEADTAKQPPKKKDSSLSVPSDFASLDSR